MSSIRRRTPGSSTSSCLQQAPHRLFQQQTRPDRLRGASPRQEGPSNRVAPQSRGHVNADRGGSVSSRPQEKMKSVSVHGTDFQSMNQAHPPPDRPRRNPSCAVLAARKAHLAFRPQGCGQMSPCRPCRPDRDAFGPANWASCPPCHHVAAFPDRGSRPPPLTRPRPPVKWSTVLRKPTSEAIPQEIGRAIGSAPGREAVQKQLPDPSQQPRPFGPHAERPLSESDASSQAAGHPLSLRPCCYAPACRLRRSYRRPRGPIAFPRSGCPAGRSRHPAAL